MSGQIICADYEGGHVMTVINCGRQKPDAAAVETDWLAHFLAADFAAEAQRGCYSVAVAEYLGRCQDAVRQSVGKSRGESGDLLGNGSENPTTPAPHAAQRTVEAVIADAIEAGRAQVEADLSRYGYDSMEFACARHVWLAMKGILTKTLTTTGEVHHA